MTTVPTSTNYAVCIYARKSKTKQRPFSRRIHVPIGLLNYVYMKYTHVSIQFVHYVNNDYAL